MTRLSLLLGLLFFILIARIDPIVEQSSMAMRPYGPSAPGWMLALELSTNAFFTWRPDPILASLFERGSGAIRNAGVASGLVFILGFSLYLHLVSRRRPAGFFAALLVAAVFTLFTWWDPLESTCRHASLSIL